jgi:ABC-2 type transport system permease protein
MQVFGLLIAVFPLYFVTGALQSTMADAIANESDQLFGFVLIGSIALMLVTSSMTVLPGVIGGGIATGYFESLLMTRASLPAVFVGLTSYGMLLTALRGTVMVVGGWAIGASVAWGQILPGLFILILLIAAHFGVGLMAAALVIAFRTSGPLTTIVTTVSTFFGGVYYPVSSIPSWLGAIATVTPLSYGLRSLRRVLLQGESLSSVAVDLAILAGMGVVIMLLGVLSMRAALTYARRAGTLGMY